ncbi:RraA family protein [Chelativorans salis]|uniref:Putative 4-hydroxy-4-methyl-2-oxoglutarate aldolase n=1 Tax=Chelativorans salis TaxID=2978478 RepID=A0ABT2LQ31_9HYPH|nr:RraA family protein [Chelativorans sp. EGI FJ00035]MCT7376656.1 RraA family protein [Chelativorans sp. EGI FJ00035]
MDKNLIEGFRRVATASVADAVDKICGSKGYLDSAITPRTSDRKIAGPAATVLEEATSEEVPPTHALELVDNAAPGSVMVISVAGDCNVAVWGGLMTAGAVANRLEAAVLDGAVRDITEIKRDFGFPVFARSASPGTTVGRYKTIASMVPVTIGDVTINPGDIVVGDVDGVVIVPREKAAEVLAAAQGIDLKEAEQAKLIIASGSLKEGMAKYGRI